MTPARPPHCHPNFCHHDRINHRQSHHPHSSPPLTIKPLHILSTARTVPSLPLSHPQGARAPQPIPRARRSTSPRRTFSSRRACGLASPVVGADRDVAAGSTGSVGTASSDSVSSAGAGEFSRRGGWGRDEYFQTYHPLGHLYSPPLELDLQARHLHHRLGPGGEGS